MPLTIAENENNDLFLGLDSNIAMIVDAPAVAQLCKAAVETILGEMIYDVTTGIPYFNIVFDGTPNLSQLEAYLRNAIASKNGVMSVENIEILQQNGALSYSVDIITAYGFESITGEFPITG